METATIIIDAVKELGFPIACVVALFYLLYRQQQEQAEQNEKWAALIAECTAAINSVKQLISTLHGGGNNDC